MLGELKNFYAAAALAIASLTLPACSEDTNCRNTSTCPVADASTPPTDNLPRSRADAAGGEHGTGGRQTAEGGLGGGQGPGTGGGGTSMTDGGPPKGCAKQGCKSPTPICGAEGDCVTCLAGEGCEGVAPKCLLGVTDRDNRCVQCVESIDCPSEKPICAANECVACIPGPDGQLGTGCAEKLTCKAGTTPPEHSCVGCVTDNQCQGGICKDQTCIPCDAADNKGCGGPAPKCLPGATPIVNSCVACLSHGDCPAACQANTCAPCSTVDNQGCTVAAPLCKAGATTAQNACVECLSDGQCLGGICEGNVCMPCNDTTDRGCTGPKPQCLAGATDKQNSCVECTASGQCTAGSENICNNNECVECTANANCTNAAEAKCSAARSCEKCTADADCSHIAGKSVCDTGSGACVQCTGKKYAACGKSVDDKQLVCDSLAKTCTTVKERDSGFCIECVTDAQCNLGQFCVETKLGSMTVPGRYCLWEQGNAASGAPEFCAPDAKPTIGLAANVTSIDGNVGTMCVPRATTCPALNDFSAKDCDPGASAADEECGVPGMNDAVCIPFGGGHRCSNICGGNEDCRGAFACKTDVEPSYCLFQ